MQIIISPTVVATVVAHAIKPRHIRVVCVANQLDQLVRATGLPVGVDDVTPGDLQSPARPGQSPVRVDLRLHLPKRGDGHAVRVGREVTMRAAEGAIGRPHRVAAVDHVTADHLKFVSQLS